MGVGGLGPVAKTLLLPLYFRVVETRRPDGVLRDPAAAALIERIDHDFSRFERLGFYQTLSALRDRRFDRHVRDFLAREPDGVVVELGCGLDTRFDRQDNGRASWWELDLPEVIALRRHLIPEGPRRRFIARSATDPDWIDRVAAAGRPGPGHLFVAEAVLPYIALEDVRALVARLAVRFPGAELVFDVLAPWLATFSRWHPALRALRQAGLGVRWGLARAEEVEAWAPGLRVLETWRYFDAPDPRLGAYRWLRWLPLMAGSSTVLRCRLGVPGAASTASPGAQPASRSAAAPPDPRESAAPASRRSADLRRPHLPELVRAQHHGHDLDPGPDHAAAQVVWRGRGSRCVTLGGGRRRRRIGPRSCGWIVWRAHRAGL